MSAKEATVLEDSPQKRLLSLEAQHISHVTESCIRKVEFAVTLPAYLQLNRASAVANKELSRALQEHQVLHERHERLDCLEQESDGEREGEVWEARKRARAQVEEDVKNSVRDLLRLVRVHPDAISGSGAEQGIEVGESECILISVFEKFHSGVVKKLSTSLGEELQRVFSKPESTSPVLNLDREVLKLERDIEQVDAKISQTHHKVNTLHSILQGKVTHEAGTSPLALKQPQSQIKTSTVKQSRFQLEFDQVNMQLNNLILENRQAEKLLQEQNEKVETEIEYLLQKFDDDMEENQTNLELNEMDFEREEEELRMLEKPFSVLEVECNEIQERRRLAEEKRQEEMRELELKTKAAVLAQAWWRGYSTRKALKNKGKSKKAKKGKGKKTK